MPIEVVKSKIYRVTVTGTDFNYIRSITVDEKLLELSTTLSRLMSLGRFSQNEKRIDPRSNIV